MDVSGPGPSLVAVVVPVYATSSAEDIQYIFRHSGFEPFRFITGTAFKVAGLTDQMIANGLITLSLTISSLTLSLRILENGDMMKN